ncbi:MAG TPA: hypothetical protein PK246_09285 [Saprospiraceae bacterium]|nr:hypothetical protein [Saprospiraceae bacterium]
MKYVCLIICFLQVISCTNHQTESELIVANEQNGIKVRISHSAGNYIDGAVPLACPFNIGHSVESQPKDSLFVILGNSITKDKTLPVRPIAKLQMSDDNLLKEYVVATVPSDTLLNFEGLVTEYAYVRNIVETYLNNYKGLGKTKVMDWSAYKK